MRAGLGPTQLRQKDGIAALAYLAVFVVTVFGAYWALFGQFRVWDDEGVFEYGIRLFDHGHPLYSGFYTDYGPFSYELWGGLFALLGRNITTDSGRLIQVVIWSFSCLALGLASHRLSRRLAVGISVQALSFIVLWVMDNEPMHPGGLIILLLSVAVCVVVFGLERWPRGSLFALGAIVACVVLSKVNLGGFAAIALVFATVMAHPALRARSWLRRLAAVVLVAVAPVLTLSNLSQDWAQRYAILIAGGALALVIVAGSVRVTADHGPAGLAAARKFAGSWIAGVVAAGVVIVGIAIVSGSSLSALITDVFIQPSQTSKILADNPPGFGARVVPWALVAVAVVWGLRRSGVLRHPEYASRLATALPRLIAGLAIWLSVASIAPLSIGPDPVFALAAALAWLAAVPPSGSIQTPPQYFARLFITALALLVGLDAYPVTGSQVWFGAVLFLVCGAICIGDGLSELEAWGEARAGANSPRISLSPLLGVFATALAIIFLYNAEQEVVAYQSEYESNVPVHVNGASHLRLGIDQASGIEQVIALLRAHCRSLVSLPGRSSFNEWSGLPTPLALLVLEDGPATMTAADQRRALSAVRSTPGLCVLMTAETGPGPGPGLAVNYIPTHFHSIADISGASDSGPFAYTVEVRGKPRRPHAHRRHG